MFPGLFQKQASDAYDYISINWCVLVCLQVVNNIPVYNHNNDDFTSFIALCNPEYETEVQNDPPRSNYKLDNYLPIFFDYNRFS